MCVICLSLVLLTYQTMYEPNDGVTLKMIKINTENHRYRFYHITLYIVVNRVSVVNSVRVMIKKKNAEWNVPNDSDGILNDENLINMWFFKISQTCKKKRFECIHIQNKKNYSCTMYIYTGVVFNWVSSR